MMAIEARENCCGVFASYWNPTGTAHVYGRYLSLTKRYLPPPRRTPRGGFDERENFHDRKPVPVYPLKDVDVFRRDAEEDRELSFTHRCSAIETTNGQVIHRYRNRGMPTRRGQSPKERQTFVKKRKLGFDVKTEREEIEGASS